MSNALYCDRCHTFSMDEPFKAKSPDSNWTLDLCSACLERYKEWLKEDLDAKS